MIMEICNFDMSNICLIILFLCVGGYDLLKYITIQTSKKISNYKNMSSIMFRLNNNIHKSNKNKYKIIMLTLFLIFNSTYKSFIYYINSFPINKKSDKLYELTYYIKGNKYIFLIDITKKSENDVLQILDQDLNDCTDDIIPYIGPLGDFHKNEITPKYFNKTKLSFTLSDENTDIGTIEKVFDENDFIKLK